MENTAVVQWDPFSIFEENHAAITSIIMPPAHAGIFYSKRWPTCITFHSPISTIFRIAADQQIALLILNQPIVDWELFTRLWNKANLKVAVDGGSNQCYHLSSKMKLQNAYIPDIICGDLDSAAPETLDFYRKKGSQVIKTADQDATDFTKALRLVVSIVNEKKLKVSAFVAFVSTTGRFDHIFGLVNTLFLAKGMHPSPVYLVSHESISWLLESGTHTIKIPSEAMTSSCGLIPVGEPCSCVTTTGFKWNLNGQPMQFGNLISTSNTFSDSTVKVKTDKPLLYTMEKRSSVV